MADAYTGAFTYIEQQCKVLLAADAWLLVGSGTRLECKIFEEEPRETEADYADHELPAISCDCAVGEVDEDVAISGLVQSHFELTVFVVSQAAAWENRRLLCKDISARVITTLASQYGANQMSGLDALVPDADGGSVVVNLQDASFDESGGGDSEQPYRAVGIITFDVSIDITR